MAALAEALVSSGDEVMFSSSGEVTRWIRAKGFPCNDVPLVDVEFTDAGAFSATETMKFFPAIAARVVSQVQLEVKNIGRFAPHVVLSDSVASTVLASKMLGVRSVAILNQLRLISSPRTPRTVAKLLSAASVVVGGAFWDLSHDVLVPDLPPPHTISERNLWGAGHVSARARYIGFLTPRRAPNAGADAVLSKWRGEDRRRRVFWQISGPPATRGPFLAKAMETAKALEDECVFVITAGNPGGQRSPSKVPGGYLYPWCDLSSSFIDSSDAVVSRAGHVSISDYILRAKPSILVPIRAQTEQMGNASKAQKLGLAIAIDETRLTPEAVRAALRQLSAESFAARAAEMKRVADGFDALGDLLRVVRSA
jgi:UDP:flavonoid glycosyltransferase YjiC (YdhE family)